MTERTKRVLRWISEVEWLVEQDLALPFPDITPDDLQATLFHFQIQTIKWLFFGRHVGFRFKVTQ